MKSSSRLEKYSLSPSSRFVIIGFAAFNLLALASLQARSPINLDVLTRDGYGMVSFASAATKISTDRLESTPRGNSMVVHATVNGRPANLVVDTGWGGAPGVYLDSNFAATLKLPLQGGEEKGYSTSGNAMSQQKAGAGTVVIGNVELNGVPFFAGKIRGFNITESRSEFWMSGVLNRGFLHSASAVLDLSNHRMYLRPSGKGRSVSIGPALKAIGMAEISLTPGPGRGYLVDVDINGQSAKMIVDTGAYVSHVDERFSGQVKGGTYEAYSGSVDASGVASRNRAMKLQTITVGGASVRMPEDIGIGKYSFYSPGEKVVGLLGMDVLGYNLGILDLGNNKLYLAPAK